VDVAKMLVIMAATRPAQCTVWRACRWRMKELLLVMNHCCCAQAL